MGLTESEARAEGKAGGVAVAYRRMGQVDRAVTMGEASLGFLKVVYEPRSGAILGATVAVSSVWSRADNAAIVDGAAAKAAAGKVGKHRDLVLAGNPDNRLVPFAVEEGGRLGTTE